MGDASGSVAAFSVFVIEVAFLAAYAITAVAPRSLAAARRIVLAEYTPAEWASALFVIGFAIAAGVAASAAAAADVDGRRMNEERQLIQARNRTLFKLPSDVEGLRRELYATGRLRVCPGGLGSQKPGHK